MTQIDLSQKYPLDTYYQIRKKMFVNILHHVFLPDYDQSCKTKWSERIVFTNLKVVSLSDNYSKDLFNEFISSCHAR